MEFKSRYSVVVSVDIEVCAAFSEKLRVDLRTLFVVPKNWEAFCAERTALQRLIFSVRLPGAVASICHHFNSTPQFFPVRSVII